MLGRSQSGNTFPELVGRGPGTLRLTRIWPDLSLWEYLGLHPWLHTQSTLKSLKGRCFSYEPLGVHEAPPR